MTSSSFFYTETEGYITVAAQTLCRGMKITFAEENSLLTA